MILILWICDWMEDHAIGQDFDISIAFLLKLLIERGEGPFESVRRTNKMI